MKHAFGYDDSLDAFGVHGVGGTIGAVLTGVFAVAAVNCPPTISDARLGLVEGNGRQVLSQTVAAVMTWVIAAIGSLAILKVVDMTLGLRVSEEDEFDGLDLSQHGESGYNIEDAFSATFAGGGGATLAAESKLPAAATAKEPASAGTSVMHA
jgi:Amt family ammonium transporter